jgi:hypothetical protein
VLSPRPAKLHGILGIAAGAFLLLVGLLATPVFLQDHLGFPASLPDKTLQGIAVLRLVAICIGAAVAVLSVLNLTCPSRVDRFVNSASGLGEGLQTPRYYWPFCVLCFLAALVLGLIATQSGPGLTPDSFDYITIAESIFRGDGLAEVFAMHKPLGPLYPLSIAALMHLGVGAEQAAGLAPVLSFALLMFPLFFLGKAIHGVSAGYLACLTCLFFSPLLWTASYAWTEMLYILLSALALLFLTKFADSAGSKNWVLCLSGVFVALAILTRHVGLTLLLVGAVVIVAKNRSRLRRTLYQIPLFVSVCCVPFAPWLFRNAGLVMDLGGRAISGSSAAFIENTDLALTVLVVDFFFGGNLNHYMVVAITAAGFGLVALYVSIHLADARALGEYLSRNTAIIAYLLIYIPAIVALTSVVYSFGVQARYLIPIYPFLILAAVSFLLYAHGRLRMASLRTAVFSTIAILSLLFVTFQAYNSLYFCQGARNGLGYSHPYWREHQGISWLTSNVPEDAVVYSTYLAKSIEFMLGRPVGTLPDWEDAQLRSFLCKVASRQECYVIGFESWPEGWPMKDGQVWNAQIAEMNREYDVLAEVADFSDSTIWRVR